jgi:hypothetical protein
MKLAEKILKLTESKMDVWVVYSIDVDPTAGQGSETMTLQAVFDNEKDAEAYKKKEGKKYASTIEKEKWNRKQYQNFKKGKN